MKIIYKHSPNTTITRVIKTTSELVSLHITIIPATLLTVEETVMRNLYSDLLLSGTATMTREQFLDAVNETGGAISIKSYENKITITLETITARLPKLLKLFRQMLQNPTLSKKELKRAIISYQNQLRVIEKQAKTMAYTNLTRKLYYPTAALYQYTPTEQQVALATVTRLSIHNLHQIIMSNHWTVTVGGNIANTRLVEKFINQIHRQTNIAPDNNKILTQTKLPTTATFVTYNVSSQQNIEIAIGQRLALKLTDDDYPALIFALAVLGRWGGFAGRLMNTIREQAGLTYGIYCRAETAGNGSYGHWRIMTFFQPDDLEKGLTSVGREVQKFYNKGITSTELTRFKAIISTSHILLFDSLLSLSSTVHSYQTKKLSFSEYELILQKMQALTTNEINTVIKKYINPEKLTYSIAGNCTPLASQIKKLRQILKL